MMKLELDEGVVCPAQGTFEVRGLVDALTYMPLKVVCRECTRGENAALYALENA